MFTDIHKSKSNQNISRIAMTAIQVVAVGDRILSFRAAALGIEVFEAFRVSWDRRQESQIGVGLDVQGVSHPLFRWRTVVLKGAFLVVKDPVLFAVFAGGGTGKDMRGFLRVVALVSHAFAAGTQRCAIRFKGDVGIHRDLGSRGARRVGFPSWSRCLRRWAGRVGVGWCSHRVCACGILFGVALLVLWL